MENTEMACAVERTRVAGVDPGFTATGVVVLEEEHDLATGGYSVRLLTSQVLRTSKTPQKERSNLRVTNDDVRRYGEIFAGLAQLLREHRVNAMGVEAYRVAPRFGRKAGPDGEQDAGGAGAGAKTMAVYGGILGVGVALGLYITPWLPNDLKKRFTGKQSASKEEVWGAVCVKVPGLADVLSRAPKSQREHLGDAAGHALLTLEEGRRIRQFIRGGPGR